MYSEFVPTYKANKDINTNISSSPASLTSKSYWLGATDEAEEGMWVFSHNQLTVPMGNPFWKHGKPSVSTSSNCAVLDAASDHRWADVSCTFSSNTICLRDD